MRCYVKPDTTQGGWNVCVEHDGPYVMLATHFDFESDANFWRDRFNACLEAHTMAAIALYRPVQSLSEDIYGTKGSPSRG